MGRKLNISSFNQTNIIEGPVFYFPFYEASFGSVSGSLVLQGTQNIPFPLCDF